MPQSLSKIYLHLIFHVKSTSPVIREEDLTRVHEYIGGLINSQQSQVIKVGGICDHVHILFVMNKMESPARMVEEIKRNSSRWIKTLAPRYEKFSWQGGYAIYSVSQSLVYKTEEYINNQAEHHKRVSFKDEYLSFLKSYGVDFDLKYVLTD